MTPKQLINPCKCGTHHSPMLKLLLEDPQAKHYARPIRGDASRIKKHDNILKVDINDIHKQEHQLIRTPNNITNISKSEGGECLRKSTGPKT